MIKQQILYCNDHQNDPIMFIKFQKNCQNPLLCCRCVAENPQSCKLSLLSDILTNQGNTYINNLPILQGEEDSVLESTIRKILKENLNMKDSQKQQQIEDFFNQIKEKILNAIESLKKKIICSHYECNELNNFYQNISKIKEFQNIIQSNNTILEKQQMIMQLVDQLYDQSDEITKQVQEKMILRNSFYQFDKIQEQLNNLSTDFIEQCNKAIEKVQENVEVNEPLKLDYTINNVEKIISFFKKSKVNNDILKIQFQQSQYYPGIQINTVNNETISFLACKYSSQIAFSDKLQNDNLYMVEFQIKNHQEFCIGYVAIGLVKESELSSEFYHLRTIKLFAYERNSDCSDILKGRNIQNIQSGDLKFRMYFCIQQDFLIFTDQSSNNICYSAQSNLFQQGFNYKLAIGLQNTSLLQSLDILSIKSIQM